MGMMDPDLYRAMVEAATPVRADPGTIVYLAVTAAYVAYSYYRKPKQQKGLRTPDDSETQLSGRGAPLSLAYGRHWLGAIHAVRGKRYTRDRAGEGTGVDYFEQAAHLIAVGPMTAYYGFSSSRSTGDGIVHRVATILAPDYDAVEYEVDRGDDFALYPGTPDSPAPPNWVRRRMKDAWTHFPGVSAVYWDPADKGSQGGYFDERQYDTEHLTWASNALGVPRIIVADDLNGVNPAYVIHDILTLPPPHGSSIPAKWIHGPGLTDFAATMEAEQLAFAAVLAGDLTTGGVFEEMLTSYGMGLPEVEGCMWPRTVRAGGPTIALDYDRIAFFLQPQRSDKDDRATAIEFGYSDHSRLSRKSYVPVGVNAMTQLGGGKYDGEEDLKYANCATVATKIAGLRRAQMLADSRVTFAAGWDAEQILPMDVLAIGDDLVLVTSKKTDILTGWCDLEGLVNPPLATDASVLDPGRETDDEILDPAPDLLVFLRGTPSGAPGVIVLRVRAHEQIERGIAHVSNGGSPYVAVGSPVTHSAGGPVLEGNTPSVERWQANHDYTEGGARVIPSSGYEGDYDGLFFIQQNGRDTGETERTWPTQPGEEVTELAPGRQSPVTWRSFADSSIVFQPLNQDHLVLPDLTSDSAGWKRGQLVVTLRKGGEAHVGYAQRVTAIGEDAWTPGGSLAAGKAVTPSASATGLRYVAQNGGSLGDTEPPIYPARIGETIVSGDVTLVARAFRQRIQNVLWGHQETPRPSGSLVGAEVFVSRGDVSYVVRDARIQSGQAVDVKVQPRQGDRAVPLDQVGAVTVTPE